MKKKLLNKTLVYGTIILLGIVSIASAVKTDVVSTEMNDNIKKSSRDIKTFTPTDDVSIKEYTPNQNYATSYLVVRNRYGGTGAGYEDDVLIKFDISELPSNVKIKSATLALFYYKWSEHPPDGRPLTLYRITSDWDENTVTWNTRPSYDPVVVSTVIVQDSPNVWMKWDVTSDVEKFVKGEETNHGWQIMDETYWGWYDIPATWFRQKEYGGNDIAYLEIEYSTSKDYNVITGLDEGPGWKFFLLGHITNIEIFEYEGIKFFNATALHVRGIAWNLFRNYPNIPLPIYWIGEKFCIPYKLVKIMFPTLTGHNYLIAFGTMEI